MGSLIVILVVLVILSGYFSATETAFSCLNKIRIINWANGGNKRAKLVLKIENNFDKLITNVLIGNNIVNILATTIATIIFSQVWVDPSLSATMTTVIMTLVILTFGEILPKTMAKCFPEKFAMFSAPIIYGLSFIFYPLSFLFIMLQKLVKKIFRMPKESVTNEELITIINEAENSGGIDKDNGELIRSAVQFDDVIVGRILTPRVDITAIEKSMSMDQIFEIFKKSGFSRLPVYDKTIDNIIGFVHEKNFFLSMIEKRPNILDIIQPVLFTQEQVKVDDLLKQLQKNKAQIAIVVDEFGGTDGLVTMEDCIEELVGEIYDETDKVEEPIQKLDDKNYLVQGSADLEMFFDLFKIKVDNFDEIESNTVGGWICEYLGLLPNNGVAFEFKGLKIEVVENIRHRINKVKVTKE